MQHSKGKIPEKYVYLCGVIFCVVEPGIPRIVITRANNSYISIFIIKYSPNPFSAGIVCRRPSLTSKDGPRTEKIT